MNLQGRQGFSDAWAGGSDSRDGSPGGLQASLCYLQHSGCRARLVTCWLRERQRCWVTFWSSLRSLLVSLLLHCLPQKWVTNANMVKETGIRFPLMEECPRNCTKVIEQNQLERTQENLVSNSHFSDVQADTQRGKLFKLFTQGENRAGIRTVFWFLVLETVPQNHTHLFFFPLR